MWVTVTRYLLRENTVDCMRTLCTACQTLNIRFTNEDSRVWSRHCYRYARSCRPLCVSTDMECPSQALCEVILRCPQAGDKIPLDIVQPIQVRLRIPLCMCAYRRV